MADSVIFCMLVVSFDLLVVSSGIVVRRVVLKTGTHGFFCNFLDGAEVRFKSFRNVMS